jgi:hypothetical protein
MLCDKMTQVDGGLTTICRWNCDDLSEKMPFAGKWHRQVFYLALASDLHI